MKYQDFVKLKGQDAVVRIESLSRDTFIDDPELAFTDKEFEQAKFYVEKVGILRNVQDIRHMGYGWGEVCFDNGACILVDNNNVELFDGETTGIDYLPEVEGEVDLRYGELTADEKAFADKVILALVPSGQSRSTLIENAVTLAIKRTQMYNLLWDKS
jgi:hypothetical protein